MQTVQILVRVRFLLTANGWISTFSNLDKNQAGTTAITYTVVEDEVEGYTAEVTGDVTSGFDYY